MTERFVQTTLALYATADKTFDQYVVGANAVAVEAVQEWVRGERPYYLFLYGQGAVGKSHLAQAALRALDGAGLATMYAPLNTLRRYGPDSIAGLDVVEAVALDDLECVVGDLEWETAVFNLFNQALAEDKRLLITADRSPRQFECKLADLASRLSAGLVCQLVDLDDAGKQTYLMRRAAESDIELPNSVAEYIITRCNRDLDKLSDTFDRIDAAALSAGRRLTVPFVKQMLRAE